MGEIISEYDEKRITLMNKFKGDLQIVIGKFQQEKLRTSLESLEKNTEEGLENWKEVEPRMEAINQIKSIFKSKFAPRRNNN